MAEGEVDTRQEGHTSVLRNLRFQSKLVLVLMMPLCALAVFSASGIRSRLSVLDATQQYAELVTPNAALERLSAALEGEGVVSSWYLVTEGESGGEQLQATRRTTDRAVDEFRDVLPGLAAGGVSVDTETLLARLSDELEGLSSYRGDLDRLELPSTSPADFFFGLDQQIRAIDEQIARGLDDPEVSADLFVLVELRQLREASARQAAIVVSALATGSVDESGRNELAAAIEAEQTHLGSFFAQSGDETLAALNDAQANQSSTLDDAAPTRGQSLLAALPEVRVSAAEWYQTTAAKAAVLGDGIAAVRDVVTDHADSREASARDDVLLYAAGAALAILAALGVAWAVTRSTVRPLEVLTRAAKDVSHRQLPQLVESLRQGGEPTLSGLNPIRVSSRDEIGELGRAFNAIQSVTVDVARDQSTLLRRGISDLFVNLARRNQSLLDRQIELIDRLESDEEDPDALESLFKLDHLATRMRRNAESLLVLSGGEQLFWRSRDPIPLMDVTRAAAAEIADFARVSITGLDHELAVTGSVVADLTHLIAELLENATSFSPPHTPVTVAGRWDQDCFELSVTDEGLGMPEDRLAEANALLSDPPAAGLALSRILGLYVVGHLAARHGIRVELRPGRERGVTALVVIPSTLLVDEARRGAGPPPEGRVDEPVERNEPPMEVPSWVQPHAPTGGRHVEPAWVDDGRVEPVAIDDGDAEPAPTPAAFWSVDAWVAGLFEEPVAEPRPSPARALPGGPSDDAVVVPSRPAAPLTCREPGRNLLHLPMRRDGLIEAAEVPGGAEPGASRAEDVRQLLGDHRRGIERADAQTPPWEAAPGDAAPGGIREDER
jgi:signal transduction histidine kinase